MERSANEQRYCLEGVSANLRADGRSRLQRRAVSVETGVAPQANGSARARASDRSGADVLVAVKVEIEEPGGGNPDQGALRFSVECAALDSSAQHGAGADEVAAELEAMLESVYCASPCLDLRALCIEQQQYAWVVYVDVLVLARGGSLLDMIGAGVAAALKDTGLPQVQVMPGEAGGAVELEISDDPYDTVALDTSRLPQLVTLSRIGGYSVADATAEEEACASAMVSIAVAPSGTVLGVHKRGTAGLHHSIVAEMLPAAVQLCNS